MVEEAVITQPADLVGPAPEGEAKEPTPNEVAEAELAKKHGAALVKEDEAGFGAGESAFKHLKLVLQLKPGRLSVGIQAEGCDPQLFLHLMGDSEEIPWEKLPALIETSKARWRVRARNLEYTVPVAKTAVAKPAAKPAAKPVAKTRYVPPAPKATGSPPAGVSAAELAKSIGKKDEEEEEEDEEGTAAQTSMF